MRKTVRSIEKAIAFAAERGFPLEVKPRFSLHGNGSGVARSMLGLRRLLKKGLALSPTARVTLIKRGR